MRGEVFWGIVEKYWVLNAWCDILKKTAYVYDGNINIRFKRIEWREFMAGERCQVCGGKGCKWQVFIMWDALQK